jgi:hypothetical protein
MLTLGSKATVTKRALTGVAVAVAAMIAAPVLGHGDRGEEQRGPKSRHPGHAAEARDMRLVGLNDLQARSAYQPIVHKQGSRWIAYIGHHGGTAPNPQNGGIVEGNGTSIVDVTNPRRPVYLKHLPGAAGAGEAGGAQMVRLCSGDELPHGNAGRYYLLRSLGGSAHQIFDVTDPANPVKIVDVPQPTGPLRDTHKSWWECDTGIAYLVSGVGKNPNSPDAWRTSRHIQVFDLGDPTHPRHIRDFGLPGQQPAKFGGTGPVETQLHGPISIKVGKDSTGKDIRRVIAGYGTNRNGILQVLDRDKLVEGDPAEGVNRFVPTNKNLLYPQISRYDTGDLQGAHTTFPVYGMAVPGFQEFTEGQVRNMVAIVNESIGNECKEPPQLMYMVDITNEKEPIGVSNFQVDEKSGDFCSRGGRFGTHSSNEAMGPPYYGKVLFLAYFNAGVRAVDIRDPWRLKEIAYFIPATTPNTDQRCVTTNGVQTCKIAIQSNNLEVDERGFIYVVDRANTGMHILALTGDARKVADLPEDDD